MTSFFFHFTVSIKSQAFLQKWNYSVGTQNISQLRTTTKRNDYLNCSWDLSAEGEAIVIKVVLVTEAVSFIEWNIIRPKLEKQYNICRRGYLCPISTNTLAPPFAAVHLHHG